MKRRRLSEINRQCVISFQQETLRLVYLPIFRGRKGKPVDKATLVNK